METVLLVIHLILALAIIGLVLLQRSEGGGLGIGGSGMGNLASAHGAASALTKATALAGAAFFITSLTLGVIAGSQKGGTDRILQQIDKQTAPASAPADMHGGPDSGDGKQTQDSKENDKGQADSSVPKQPSVPVSE